MTTEQRRYKFGELNPVYRQKIRKKPQDYYRNPNKAIRDAAVEVLTPNALEGAGPFKAICLRVEKDNSLMAAFSRLTGIGEKPLVKIKARIPEVHSMLPDPEKYGDVDGHHQKIIDMYPTFEAQDSNVPEVKEGELVWVTFGNLPNMEDPIYIGPVFPEAITAASGYTLSNTEPGMGESYVDTSGPIVYPTKYSAKLPKLSASEFDFAKRCLLLTRTFECSGKGFADVTKDIEFQGWCDKPSSRTVHPALRHTLSGWEPHSNSRYNDKWLQEGGEPKSKEEEDRQYNHVGLTYGISQVTQRAGGIGTLLKVMYEADPTEFVRIFGAEWDILLAVTNTPGDFIREKVNKLSKSQIPKENDRESTVSGFAQRSPRCAKINGEDLSSSPKWRQAFTMAATVPVFRGCQVQQATSAYFPNMMKYNKDGASTKACNITSELGLAMMYDNTVNAGNPGWWVPKLLQSKYSQGTDKERMLKILKESKPPAKMRKHKIFWFPSWPESEDEKPEHKEIDGYKNIYHKEWLAEFKRHPDLLPIERGGKFSMSWDRKADISSIVSESAQEKIAETQGPPTAEKSENKNKDSQQQTSVPEEKKNTCINFKGETVPCKPKV